MAVFNKFNQFVQDLANGKHVFNSNSFKVMLSNVAPVATNAVKTDITEIGAGLGYTAGGNVTTISESLVGGLLTIKGTTVTFTSTGAMAAFRYAVLYNDTTAGKPLVGWWDYGSAISLLNTEQFQDIIDPINGIFSLQ